MGEKLDIDKFIENINKTDWHKYDNQYDGISSFAPAVAEALIWLALVEKEEDMYHQLPTVGGGTAVSNKYFIVLDAVGNNHAGFYYPVVKEALPFITEAALDGNSIFSRLCAVNILSELNHFSCYPGDSEVEDFVARTLRTLFEKTFSVTIFIFEGKKLYTLRYIDYDDDFLTEDGKIIYFKSEIELKHYIRKNKLIIQQPEKLYDIDKTEEIVSKKEPLINIKYAINVPFNKNTEKGVYGILFHIWDEIRCIANAINVSFYGNEKEAGDIRFKLLQSLLDSVDIPVWNENETEIILKVLHEFHKIFKASYDG